MVSKKRSKKDGPDDKDELLRFKQQLEAALAENEGDIPRLEARKKHFFEGLDDAKAHQLADVAFRIGCMAKAFVYQPPTDEEAQAESGQFIAEILEKGLLSNQNTVGSFMLIVTKLASLEEMRQALARVNKDLGLGR